MRNQPHSRRRGKLIFHIYLPAVENSNILSNNLTQL
jgi:hypothetical protein